MILKASQRAGANQLGVHLLKTEENEHVEIHEVSGFVADSVLGAMKEAQALSLGTKCKQYLFSVSLNPPSGENAAIETFEAALGLIEERTGLTGQPRIVVFHEKEGRRHCHAVWSRIDAETMTAKPLPFFKIKLNSIAKQLYIENGWQLPAGFIDPSLRDPRNFTLDEWQQCKRAKINPADLKAAVQHAWSSSDGRAALSAALEERGLFLARGNRRAAVVVNVDGEVFALSRLAGKKTKEVAGKLGDASELASLEDVRKLLAGQMNDRLRGHISEARRIGENMMKPLIERKSAMKNAHQQARKSQATEHEARSRSEQRERASRVRRGLKGVMDILTGRYFKMRKQNELEAQFAKERDLSERNALIRSQLDERRDLQSSVRAERDRQSRQITALQRDAARFRRMRETGQQQERGRELDLG